MKRQWNLLVVAAAALLLAAVLAGCGPTPAPGSTGEPAATSPAGQPALAGTSWVLTSLRGQPALESTRVTLEFEAGTVGGSAGCNSYGGGANNDPYVATPDGELALPEIASTLMACADAAVMQQEADYLDALASVERYRVEGDALELQNGAGETV
ncbi:MAG TPA: META domain-containing protein, partial [Anaerolineae bacterium]|nr:META domain-containing protein [Anaerolineae bacterium]